MIRRNAATNNGLLPTIAALAAQTPDASETSKDRTIVARGGGPRDIAVGMNWDCGVFGALKDALTGSRSASRDGRRPDIDVVQCKAHLRQALSGRTDRWKQFAVAFNRLTGFKEAAERGQSAQELDEALQDLLYYLPMVEQYILGAEPIVTHEVRDVASWRMLFSCMSCVFGDMSDPVGRREARTRILNHTHPDKTPFLARFRNSKSDAERADLDLIWRFSLLAANTLKHPMLDLGLDDRGRTRRLGPSLALLPRSS